MNIKNELKEKFLHYTFNGNLKVMNKYLDLHPQLANVTVELKNKEFKVKVTPLFLAAIGGQDAIVKELLKRNVSCRNTDGDLFTWTCLCPILSNRRKILDIIFSEENRKKIHNDLPLLFKKISEGYSPHIKNRNKIEEVMRSSYTKFLSPYDSAILSGTQEAIFNFVPEFAKPSAFKKLSSLELVKFRTSMYSLLKKKEFNIKLPEQNHLELFTAIQLGDPSFVKIAKEKGVNLASSFPHKYFNFITPSFTAAFYGHVKILNILESCGVNLSSPINDGIFKGMTPAHIAAKNGYLEVLEYLACHGVDLSSPITDGTSKGMAPAHIAAENGHVEVLRLLKNSGVNLSSPINEGISKGMTPASIAAKVGGVGVLKLLEDFGVNLSSPITDGTSKGMAPAHIAAEIGNLEVLRLLKNSGVNLSSPITQGISKGMTPASIAAKVGGVGVLKLLEDSGVNLSSPITDGISKGMTPAFIAAENGHVEVLRFLKNSGVNLSSPITEGEREGKTPAFIAAENGHVKVLTLLKDFGVNLSSPITKGERQGQTPASIAAETGHVEVLSLLKNSGVNLSSSITEGNREGETPAFIAAETGHVEVLTLLKNSGVNLSSPITDGISKGMTPGHIAAESGNLKVLTLLKNSGINLSSPVTEGEWEGETPAFIAAENGHVEVLRLLKNSGVNLSSPITKGERKGQTPAFIAAENGHVEVLKFLSYKNFNPNILKKFKFNERLQCEPLHLACLLKRAAEVAQLLALEASQEAKVNNLPICGWNLLDFTLHSDETASFLHYILSNTENEQIKIIQQLIEKRIIDREKTLRRLKSNHPKIYFKLLMSFEKKILNFLSEKTLLLRVINRKAILPENSFLKWTERAKEREIGPDPKEVSDQLKNSINHVLEKNEISEQKILSSLETKLKKLLAFDFSHYSDTPILLSKKDCSRLAQLLQKIEEASHDLGSTLFSLERKPPKICWQSGKKRKWLTEANLISEKKTKTQPYAAHR